MTNDTPNYEGCQHIGADQDPAIHWPIRYCGCACLPGLPYCDEHYSQMYQKGTAYRRRLKDIRRAENIRQWESLFNEAVAELEAEGFDFDTVPPDMTEVDADLL
jgi:hypothetical protein